MRILVADDERLCRDEMVSMLHELYPDTRVEKFDDGIPLWETVKFDPDVDLVITDMSMIGMDGINLAARISGKFPDIQILFQTAESESALKQMGVQIERCLFKPVFEQDLKEKIDNLSSLPKFQIKPVRKEEPTVQEPKKRGFFGRLLQRC